MMESVSQELPSIGLRSSLYPAVKVLRKGSAKDPTKTPKGSTSDTHGEWTCFDFMLKRGALGDAQEVSG